MNSSRFVIITTINPFTKAIGEIANLGKYRLVLVGDLKTSPYKNSKLAFLDVKAQKRLPFLSLRTCPYNSYQRKNIGYLYAISNGAKTIIDTDDDNYPLKNWGDVRFGLQDIRLVSSPKIVNIYSEFTKEKIWPRGFPLDSLQTCKKIVAVKKNARIGVWQGLVNNDPDVDAIYRLTNGKRINFEKNKSRYALSSGVYCPFNSQNTAWEKSFFWYLYLPVTVSFRVTDILRGYVAQRCLWEHGALLGFTGATMYQDRNKHDLLSDFESEIPCYLFANKIIDMLDKISLSDSPADNLERVYSKLARDGIVKNGELSSLRNWTRDVDSLL